MRAMVFDRYGEPDVMRLMEAPVSEPQAGEVLIRVGYAGVNPADSKARSGQSARTGYRVRGVDFPFVTGMDGAGVVERTGSNANGFRQGDRVITWSAADGKTWGCHLDESPPQGKTGSDVTDFDSFAIRRQSVGLTIGYFQCTFMPFAALHVVEFMFSADSNPSLSATQSGLQRKPALLFRNERKSPVFRTRVVSAVDSESECRVWFRDITT